MFRISSIVLLCLWLVACPSQVQAGKKTPVENNLPSSWPGFVLNMVKSDLENPVEPLQTFIAPLPPFPTGSWMKELPCLIDRGLLSLKLPKANQRWYLYKKEKLKNIRCTTCNGVTELVFSGDISTHYSELFIKEHETTVLNMVCRFDDNGDSLSESDVVCPQKALHNDLSRKVAKIIISLDKLIEKSQFSTFSSWRPFSNTIRLYIDAEGYTHITYYQTTRGPLKLLASAVYSEAHTLTFTSHIHPEKPIEKFKVKKLEVVAIINKAPMANHRANTNRREASNDSAWIKRYKPRYLDFKTEALPPEFTTIIPPVPVTTPVATEDEYDDVIPETPPAFMGQSHSRSPSPNSFSLHLSQDTQIDTPYSPAKTFEEAMERFHASNTPDSQSQLPTPDSQDVNELISELLDTGSDSSQQTSINLSPYSLPSSAPSQQSDVNPPTPPNHNKSRRRVRRRLPIDSYSERSPQREAPPLSRVKSA